MCSKSIRHLLIWRKFPSPCNFRGIESSKHHVERCLPGEESGRAPSCAVQRAWDLRPLLPFFDSSATGFSVEERSLLSWFLPHCCKVISQRCGRTKFGAREKSPRTVHVRRWICSGNDYDWAICEFCALAYSGSSSKGEAAFSRTHARGGHFLLRWR